MHANTDQLCFCFGEQILQNYFLSTFASEGFCLRSLFRFVLFGNINNIVCSNRQNEHHKLLKSEQIKK